MYTFQIKAPKLPTASESRKQKADSYKKKLHIDGVDYDDPLELKGWEDKDVAMDR